MDYANRPATVGGRTPEPLIDTHQSCLVCGSPVPCRSGIRLIVDIRAEKESDHLVRSFNGAVYVCPHHARNFLGAMAENPMRMFDSFIEDGITPNE